MAWTDGKFDHSTTGFALTGAHTVPPRQCVDCHVNNNYNLTSTTCVSCHLKDFQGTTNPNHVSSNFPQTCEQCHSTTSWLNATFDHSTTGFPLSGAHTVPPRQCTDCHVNNNYNITATACVSCHQTDYNTATTPVPHAGFPTTCQQCHDTVAWTDGKFDHSTTGFVLTGAHTVPPRQCVDCHVNNNYNLTSTTCVSCHLKDFQGTTNPNHVSSNFPQTCQQCHSTTQLVECNFRPQHHRVPADWIAHGAAAAVYGLPRQQQLQHHRYCVRELPSDRLQHGTQPGEPRDRALPARRARVAMTPCFGPMANSTTPAPDSP